MGDVILPMPPTVYEVGDPYFAQRINDPLDELGGIAFYANGVEIEGVPLEFGNERILTFTPESEDISFSPAPCML